MKTGKYLFDYKETIGSYSRVVEVQILKVTTTAYKLKYLNDHIEWISKEEFADQYKLREKL